MAKNKTIDLQLSEVDLQALESIGVISVQNNMETGSSNSNANFRRAISWLVNRDCAMITAWRKEKKDGTPKTRAENNNDNKTLVQKLREYGYGVSKVQGCYAEVGHPLSRENSFLVFDLLNNSKLFFCTVIPIRCKSFHTNWRIKFEYSITIIFITFLVFNSTVI